MTGAFSHAELGEIRYTVLPAPFSAEDAVERSLAIMRTLAVEDSKSPLIMHECSQNNGKHPAVFVWEQAKKRFVFAEDSEAAYFVPDVVEAFIRPVDVITASDRGRKVRADCDDHSMYCASLLLAMGYSPSFVTVEVDKEAPGQYSHVYVSFRDEKGKRCVVDASHGPEPDTEVRPSHVGRKAEWPLKVNIWPLAAVLGGLLWFSR